MKNLEFGDVVLAEVWCDGGRGKKIRPCIILEPIGSSAYEVAPLTSQQAIERGKLNHEVVIFCDAEKKEMGLWKDSRVSLLNRDLRCIRDVNIKKFTGRATKSVLTRCAVAWKNAQ